MDKQLTIGIDIGGTSIKGGVVEQDGTIVKLERLKTPKAKEELVHAVINITNSLFQEFKHHHIKGIGIGCPGPLNTKYGVILKSPNLPQFTDLGHPLKNNFNVPIVFENDATCFTLAEAVHGAGKDEEIVVGLTLGTGLGAGLTINKHIYNGKGNALEMGHLIINCNEEEGLPNLAKGSVEQYLGTAGILNIARKLDLEVKEPIDIFQLAEMKNDKAVVVWKRYGYYLGITIVNCLHAFDPDIIVIGGSMNQAWVYFEEAMHAVVDERSIQGKPKIVRAAVKDAGVVGASLLL